MSTPSPAKRTRASDSDQPPIALSEAQMCALLAASYPLPSAARSAFLEHCAREIANLPARRWRVASFRYHRASQSRR